MMALRLIVALITTLLTFDSGTGTGIALFQFSGELVSALTEIQINGVQIPHNNLHAYTPDVRHSA